MFTSLSPFFVFPLLFPSLFSRFSSYSFNLLSPSYHPPSSTHLPTFSSSLFSFLASHPIPLTDSISLSLYRSSSFLFHPTSHSLILNLSFFLSPSSIPLFTSYFLIFQLPLPFLLSLSPLFLLGPSSNSSSSFCLLFPSPFPQPPTNSSSPFPPWTSSRLPTTFLPYTVLQDKKLFLYLSYAFFRIWSFFVFFLFNSPVPSLLSHNKKSCISCIYSLSLLRICLLQRFYIYFLLDHSKLFFLGIFILSVLPSFSLVSFISLCHTLSYLFHNPPPPPFCHFVKHYSYTLMVLVWPPATENWRGI